MGKPWLITLAAMRPTLVRCTPGVAEVGLDPDSLRGRAAQGDGAGIGGQRQSLIVVTPGDQQPGAGTNAPLFEKLQQGAVAFVDAADHIVLPGFRVRQKQQSATATAGGTLHLAQIAGGTSSRASEP